MRTAEALRCWEGAVWPGGEARDISAGLTGILGAGATLRVGLGGLILTLQSRTDKRLDGFGDQLRRLSEGVARLGRLVEGSSLFRAVRPSGATGAENRERSHVSFWRVRISDTEQGNSELLAARCGITLLHRLLGPEPRRGSLDLSHCGEVLPHEHGWGWELRWPIRLPTSQTRLRHW